MARPRNPKRDEAFQMWLKSQGQMILKDIAAQLDLSDSQIRKWKNQDSWDEHLKGNVTKPNSNVTKRSRGAPVGNNNAKGHGAPKQNTNAVKHGFYSRVIPVELQDLFAEIEEGISTADMLWDQIKLQYMAIMRAQSIMFVESKDEMIKELKKRKDTQFGKEIEYEFQFAWDRQAQFLTAQSRAISELRNLIEQFDSITDKTDERRLKLEQMQLEIDKTKIAIQKENGPEEETEDDGFMEALGATAKEVWADDDA
ncbi:phage terminase small subunit [Lysinibacillus piscis]|uniref:PBSX phage terminase small subunit-like N-terminal domain-containing protein n=1 Tax=Lysinibacillus piscis TaxID=2518931 RepID=A0ABQ5NJZ7_9BACI|nr:phage terminase small subunit [Lysinibacillus sp. KH24]GLC88689.1 hypothetical protein LYSBPC_18160 [Lysinibacillus sp. KH24]